VTDAAAPRLSRPTIVGPRRVPAQLWPDGQSHAERTTHPANRRETTLHRLHHTASVAPYAPEGDEGLILDKDSVALQQAFTLDWFVHIQLLAFIPHGRDVAGIVRN